MKKLYLSTIFSAAGLLLLSACEKAPSGPVVVKAGTQSATVEELRGRLEAAPPSYQQYVATPEGRKQFLNLVVREKIVLNEAKKSGMANDKTFEAAVKKYKSNQKQQLSDYKDNLLVESYLRKLRTSELSAADTEVQQYFENHRERYSKPQELQVRHILVNTRPEAEAIAARLKKGEAFAALAKEFSRDPGSASKGGQLAPLRYGMLVPTFEDAAFALKNGQVSDIVETTFGFHIIQRLGSRDLPPQSYADVKEDIRRMLERAKFDRWITEKQKTLGASVDEKNAELLSVGSMKPGGPQAPVQEPVK